VGLQDWQVSDPLKGCGLNIAGWKLGAVWGGRIKIGSCHLYSGIGKVVGDNEEIFGGVEKSLWLSAWGQSTTNNKEEDKLYGKTFRY